MCWHTQRMMHFTFIIGHGAAPARTFLEKTGSNAWAIAFGQRPGPAPDQSTPALEGPVLVL